MDNEEIDFWRRLGLPRGDTKRQASLRDKFYKKREELSKNGISYFEGPDMQAIYLEKILERMKARTKVLDVGCGTGHIIGRLAQIMRSKKLEEHSLIGLDLSEPTVQMALKNICSWHECSIIRGDAYNLPFASSSLDIVISRTAPYAPSEVWRVLRVGGGFVRYDQAPNDYPEIAQAFGDRYTIETPTWNVNPDNWKEEDVGRHEDVGFKKVCLTEYSVTQFYSTEDLMDLIEFVPLVKDFDREKDKEKITKIESKHNTTRGIAITRYYSLLDSEK